MPYRSTLPAKPLSHFLTQGEGGGKGHSGGRGEKTVAGCGLWSSQKQAGAVLCLCRGKGDPCQLPAAIAHSCSTRIDRGAPEIFHPTAVSDWSRESAPLPLPGGKGTELGLQPQEPGWPVLTSFDTKNYFKVRRVARDILNKPILSLTCCFPAHFCE